MAFQIALTGLAAAQTDLEVTGHNIANASTIGFKEGRAEFADLYASSISDTSARSAGRGVQVTRVAQQFSQGSIDFTGNNLDLGITGEGFFITTSREGEVFYTRAGQFSVDRDGYVVNFADRKLKVFPVTSPDPYDIQNLTFSASGTPASLADIRLPTALGEPRATKNISLDLNLDSTVDVIPQGKRLGSAGNLDWPLSPPPYPTLLPPSSQNLPPPDSYDHSTATTVYDSLGQAHTAIIYFAKNFVTAGSPSYWETFIAVDRGDGYYESASTGLATDTANIAMNYDLDAAAPVGAVSPVFYGWDIDSGGGGGVAYANMVQFVKVANANPLIPIEATWNLRYFRDDGTGTMAFVGDVDFLIGTNPVVDGITFSGITDNSVGYEYTATPIIDGNTGDSGVITFHSDGKQASPADEEMELYIPTVNGSFTTLDVSVDLSKITQYGSTFDVNELAQDGFSTGRLSGIDIDSSGVVFARYTNGQSQALGKVALANFNNLQGLKRVGDTAWQETFGSGEVRVGAPQTSNLGAIQSGALEASNTDIASQLVKLIIAQRNYQANAQTVSTASTIAQTILNLR